MKFVKLLSLGSLQLPNNIIYAPMAGCTDFPFRKIASRYSPGLQFCEMVKMEALIRNDKKTLKYLEYSPDMHLIGAQLCGSNPSIAANAAKIIEDLGFDIVDFNCGCPVAKVLKDGSGAAMLKQPALIGEMISNMVAAVKIPVSVKIRIGWDYDSINVLEVVEIAEQAGAVAVFIHGRTRSQKYCGRANWEHIKAASNLKRKIKVIGNGDVFNADDAISMFEQTGCDGILIARGMLGQPWIVQEIIRKDNNESVQEYLWKEKCQVFVDYVDEIISYKTEQHAIFDIRRVGCWFFKDVRGARHLRSVISRVQSMDEVHKFIQELL